MDRCDVLDVLEEAVRARGSVEVRFRDGETIEVRVREVVTRGGEDYALLANADAVPVSQISACRRLRPPGKSYDPKLP
jgi:transcriptional antiterminator Rof (Rho-off)